MSFGYNAKGLGEISALCYFLSIKFRRALLTNNFFRDMLHMLQHIQYIQLNYRKEA